MLNSFADDKVKTFKLKEFPGKNFKFDEKDGKFSKRVENTVGRREIAY